MKKRSLFTTFLVIIILSFNSCGVEEITNEVQDAIVRAEIGEAVIVDTISADKYAYSCLSDEAKVTYDQVLNAILAHTGETVLSTRDIEVLKQASDAVMSDYGGLFWVDGYEYKTYNSKDRITGIVYSPMFTMSKGERDALQESIDQKVDAWLQELPQDADDYAKSKFVYEKLISSVEYDKNSEDNQNIISVFINGRTVCQGYACAANYLLSQLGIESLIVSGTSDGESHAWNIVKLDGQYYNMDITWGNSNYKKDTDEQKIVNFGYLNVTDEDFLLNHTPKMSIPLPKCESMDDNYYVRESLYFDTPDGDVVARDLGNAYTNGWRDISVKFATKDEYESVRNYLIDEKHFADYIGINRMTYLDCPEIRVITFCL